MRPEEAELLARWALELSAPSPGDICLNIGSSTRRFREVDQPHITDRLLRPLEDAGICFVHCDLKESDGVDEVGDLLDPDVRDRLRRYNAKLLICSSLLEHLEEPDALVRAFGDLVVEGGYALVSVPSRYPYHTDPIDTMLRPSPDELAAMFPGWSVVRKCELEAGNYWRDLRQKGKPLRRLLRHVARVALPFYRRPTWWANASRLSWLLRPYKVSLVALQNNGASAAFRQS